MPRPPSASTIAAREEERAKMAVLLSESNKQEEEDSEPDESEEREESPEEKIIVVRIPSRFTEEKVKTLMGSMESQFEGSGHKVVFVPEEVDVFFLSENPPVSGFTYPRR